MTARQQYYRLLNDGFSRDSASILSGFDEYHENEASFFTWCKWASVITLVALVLAVMK